VATTLEAGEATCTVCGASQAPGQWRCRCGGAFDLPDIPATDLVRIPATERTVGLWRYSPWIPVPRRIAAEISMGEGQTPLISAGETLPRVSVKLEFVSPTLSFKDRGAVVLVASALERGARRLVADSSGNAGSAIAAYASRAGLECTVFVPANTSMGKRTQIEAYGAKLEPVPGDRTATSDAAIAAVQSSGATYASHVYDPLFLQGTKTFAFEVFEQLSGAPDAVIVPVGNGTLLLGAARGFRELRAAGLIDRLPALIALQSERCAPLAHAWARGADAPVPVQADPTLAEGIAIPHPARGAQILATVAASGGCVVSVPEAAIEPAQRELSRRSGLLVEPTAALVWAGALLARRHPALRELPVPAEPWSAARDLATGSVVLPLCGSGLKGK
jgi:threonine synthase